MLCEAFEMSRSTYKYWRSQERRIRPEQIELNALVKSAHRLSNGSAGARTIASLVTNQGVLLSRYRAGRIMKKLDLQSTQQRKHRYRKATQLHLAIDNTLDRQFYPDKPNQVWCGVVMSRKSGQASVGSIWQSYWIYMRVNLWGGHCHYHLTASLQRRP